MTSTYDEEPEPDYVPEQLEVTELDEAVLDYGVRPAMWLQVE